ncbi:hypothetical protein [Spiroplasma poulsonii]|uniref:hypothetical protein n=1 Tax=Spiroplasma poulsonii TaxID=2138 RepID=UPI001F4CC09B|nr:hypothetical protein [Spiroplasma poulsonii]UNF62344.1 hypothetical protein MNU24_02455 [Spiroplasma poulsonii]
MIILMIKLLLMLPETQINMKDKLWNLILVKGKTLIKTQVIVEQETKRNYCNKFSLGKHDYAI